MARLQWHMILVGLLAVCGCNKTNEPQVRTAIKPHSLEDPVGVSLTVPGTAFRAGELIPLSVTLDIQAPYEIQDQKAPLPAIATKLELELPDGFQTAGEWSAPVPVRSESPDAHRVYVGEVMFTRSIRVGEDVEPGEYKITCLIDYQACTVEQCLRPTHCRLDVKVPIRRR